MRKWPVHQRHVLSILQRAVAMSYSILLSIRLSPFDQQGRNNMCYPLTSRVLFLMNRNAVISATWPRKT